MFYILLTFSSILSNKIHILEGLLVAVIVTIFLHLIPNFNCVILDLNSSERESSPVEALLSYKIKYIN